MKVNEYLSATLQSNHPNRIDDEWLNNFNEARNEIAEFIKQEFNMNSERAGNPINAGSWKKKTAVNIRFDLDLVVPFRYREELHAVRNIKNDVFQALRSKYESRGDVQLREQRTSTGIIIQRNDTPIEIDVVTGMEPREGLYSETDGTNEERNDLVLFDREAERKIKTNVHRQIRIVKEELLPYHDAIRLLKVWKKHHFDDLGSYAIELMAHKTMKEMGQEYGSPDALLRKILDYCIPKLPTLSLVDVGSGKEWEDFLQSGQKRDLQDKFSEMRRALDPNRPDLDLLKKLFPENEKFTEPKPQKNNRYGSSSYA